MVIAAAAGAAAAFLGDVASHGTVASILAAVAFLQPSLHFDCGIVPPFAAVPFLEEAFLRFDFPTFLASVAFVALPAVGVPAF